MSADRDFYADVFIEAPVQLVWAVLTDFRNLVAASPELIAMTPVKRGGLRRGQWYVGWNRRKFVVWPTRNVIDELEPTKLLAWTTATSGARWRFELVSEDGGTRLHQHRMVPRRLTLLGRAFAVILLGGGNAHADELEEAVDRTLDHLKRVAESV